MRPNFVTQKIKQLLPLIGGTLILEAEYQYAGCIIFENGKRVFFKDSSFDLNPQGAVKIAIDKGYTNYFLKKFGFSIPDFATFASNRLHLNKNKGIQEGLKFAQKLGFPVIIKPNSGTKGSHIYKVNNEAEYLAFTQKIFESTDVMMVQELAKGNDYRIVVLDEKVYCAYQRIPLQIVGNGQSTIPELLEQRAKSFKKKGSIHSFNPNDERIKSSLKAFNLSYDDILKDGEILKLLSIANLSLGGEAIDLTNRISLAYQKLVIDIARKMGLRFCGIDLMDVSIEGEVGEYAIIEINSAPGLSNFAAMGEEQEKMVNELYFDILKALK